MRESISVAEARETIVASVEPLGTEIVGILDALGRVLAEAVRSPRDLPPFDNTAMDGFAVIADDTARATPESPVILEVLEDVPAGHLPEHELRRGTAIRIMTGAPLPKGADAIVKVEDTDSEGRRVVIKAPAAPGEHVRRAGDDVRKGAIVIEPPKVITPGAIGMLASLGRSSVRVQRQPRVAILATGDELVSIDGDHREGTIIASNPYSLAAQVKECGAIPVLLGIAEDRAEAIEARLREASTCDVILSTGGVSVGDYDLVKGVLRTLGSEMQFWRVRMKPGHPLVFGTLRGKPIFGLPGNPVSCMVSFEQFVRPALRRMMGHEQLFRRQVRARLRETLRQKPGRTGFLRVVLHREGDGYSVSTTGNQSSGVMLSMVRAQGLLVFPAELGELREGETVDVQVLDPDLG